MIRFCDIVLSSVAIIVLLPFLIPVMLVLKCSGEHDVFYRQTRIGRYSKEFGLFKFATMLRNSPNLAGGLYTSRNDPRMLPLGNILRKTKINELPQLLNIFLGQMSIVGYRPTVREHYEGYPADAKKILYDARPGLTGIGSVVFRNEEEILQQFADKKAFHQNVIAPYKAALECWYIEHKNLYTYFKLIFMTAYVVLRPTSNIWRESFKDLPPVPAELAQYI